MASNPYERFQRRELILRDELAVDRTVLANERTLLSYIRTGLALAVMGAGVIKFFVSSLALLVGWCLIVFALLVMVWGVWRFRGFNVRISACRKQIVGLATGDDRPSSELGGADRSGSNVAEHRASQP